MQFSYFDKNIVEYMKVEMRTLITEKSQIYTFSHTKLK